jgi:GT2 family glycosyltransferase
VPAAIAPSLSAIVVSHESAAALERTLPALLAQLRSGDELIVIDNASGDGSADVVERLAPGARVLRRSVNAGFGSACNDAATDANGDLLLFLNPDCVVADSFRDAIELPYVEERGWGAWQGLVTSDGGTRINSSGGVVHFTGIAWAGQAGESIAAAPSEPKEVAFASGACLVVPRTTWLRHGGFAPGYFLYHEDVELSLRYRLLGERVGIEPRARVDHDYEFEKGAYKWRLLEANRWRTIVRLWPGRLLGVLAPALVLTELAVAGAALRGGWLREKALAWGELVRALTSLRAERRSLRERGAGPAERLVPWLTAELSSGFIAPAARSRLGAGAIGIYWRIAHALVRKRRN